MFRIYSNFIRFSYDPTENSKNLCGYDKERFMKSLGEFSKYFNRKEVLIVEEFWSFLSEEKNTIKKILEIINSIAKPDFKEKFDFINPLIIKISYILKKPLMNKNSKNI
ncbi:TdeIII family type II restriction endonuclease [Methanocaldococcus sp. 28A]